MKTRPCFLHRLGVALVLFASTAAATRLHAQMLLNGSFENPATSTEIFGTAGANWSQTGGGSQTIFNNADAITGGGTTPYGSQYLEVGTQGDGASQAVVGFTIGQTYVFTLAAVATATNPATVLLYVTGGATASQPYSLTQRTTTGGQFPFQTIALAFTCTSNAAITLGLVNTGANEAIAFDNAQLTVASAVPEPSTWALLGVGTAALGLVLRQRRHTATARA